jgi:DNA (cytosine-5)-methyltransferase 1
MLEKEVDEKYYLNDTTIERISQWKAQQDPLDTMEKTDKLGISPTLTARGAGEDHSGMILVKEVATLDETKEFANYLTWKDSKGRLNTQDHRAYFEDRLSGTIPAMERGVPNVLLNKEPKVDVIANIRHNGTSQSGNVYDKEQLSPTLCATDYKNPPKITEPKVSVIGNYSPSNHNASSIVDSNGLAPTVMENHGTITGVIVYDDSLIINPLKDKTQYGWHFEQNVYDDKGITRALKASEGSGNIPKVVKNNLRIRKLTPRECYRLMGFGDEAFELAQPNQSNSSLYHQAGDSIVVNVLEAIFKGLL